LIGGLLVEVSDSAIHRGSSATPHRNLVSRIIENADIFLARIVVSEKFYLWRDPISLLSLLITSAGVAVYALAPIVWLAIILLSIGGIAALGICILRTWYWNRLRVCESTIAYRSKKIDETVKSKVKNLALEKKRHEFKFLDPFPDQQNSALEQQTNENIVSPTIRTLECEKFIYFSLQAINRITAINNLRGMDRFYFRVLTSVVRDAFTRAVGALSRAKDNKTRLEIAKDLCELFTDILEPGSLAEDAPKWIKSMPSLFDSLAGTVRQCKEAVEYLINSGWTSA
jgi:hypothetical protein